MSNWTQLGRLTLLRSLPPTSLTGSPPRIRVVGRVRGSLPYDGLYLISDEGFGLLVDLTESVLGDQLPLELKELVMITGDLYQVQEELTIPKIEVLPSQKLEVYDKVVLRAVAVKNCDEIELGEWRDMVVKMNGSFGLATNSRPASS